MAKHNNKGKLLENIIYKIYKCEGVVVKKNAFLPPVDKSRSKRKREIDVLILNKLAGIDIKIAIECKNENKKIGVPKIDSFVGKLIDLGIPVRQGIFISASGFTRDALDRASVAGIKALLFKDITGDKLNEAINEAIQSITYLMLDVRSVSIVNNIGNPGEEIKFFYDESGKICGTILDLVWLNWKDGTIPSQVGKHKVILKIPSHWNQIIQGHVEPVVSAETEVVVYALVVVVPGKHAAYVLIEPDANVIDKQFTDIRFDSDEQIYPVEAYDNEDHLRARLGQYKFRVSLSGIKLPRIKYGEIYWPPSIKAISRMSKLTGFIKDGNITDMSQFKLENIEGLSLEALWEPVYSRYLDFFNE